MSLKNVKLYELIYVMYTKKNLIEKLVEHRVPYVPNNI